MLVSSGIVLSVVATTAMAAPVYVDDNAPRGGDGATWATAFTNLQDALTVAEPGDQIRVAGGTYKPDQSIISGRIVNWVESGPLIVIGDGDNHVSLWWSLNTFDRGLFYGSTYKGDSDVAHATGVSDVMQISDAFDFDFTSKVIGPFCDADCAPNGVGAFLIWRNVDTGHYGVLRIDDIHEIDGEPSLALDGTWWFQTDGTGNFVADRRATFQLKNGVALVGGYAGLGAADPDLRDVAAHQTILSGDLYGDDARVACTQDSQCVSFGRLCIDGFCIIASDNDENSYHVVTGSGTDTTAVLDGVTITAGNANGECCAHDSGGGMYNGPGSPTVMNCSFCGNAASDGGGGMENIGGSSPTVTKCTFRGNAASNRSGGMHNFGGGSNPTVINSIFQANSGGFGGGMLNEEGSATVIQCTFNGNHAINGGGIVNNGSGSNTTVTDCTFSGNRAEFGGGMYNNFLSNPMVTNCTFSGNSAVCGSGGGMSNQNCNSTVINCTFHDNSAANTSGGGIYNQVGTSIILHCVFARNTAAFGAGMDNFRNGDDAPATVTVSNCLFIANVAHGNDFRGGGGMLNFNVSPTVTNCTFSSNTAESTGGGIRNFDSSPSVFNCILWNSVPNAIANYSTNVDTSIVKYSNVQGGLPPGTTDGGGNIDADPLFVDAVGPDNILGTEDDNLRLRPGSPCIDAGDPAVVFVAGETDLDGHARVLCGRVDMGAYEFGIGDHECDQDVDPSDFANWADCMTGPDNGPFAAGCEAFDFDGDFDVDLEDYVGFQRVFLGG